MRPVPIVVVDDKVLLRLLLLLIVDGVFLCASFSVGVVSFLSLFCRSQSHGHHPFVVAASESSFFSLPAVLFVP